MWRESFDIPNIGHGDTPIPLCTRVGNLIFSSAISGKDPRSGALPAQAEDQVSLAFGNIDALLRLAGARLTDVAQMEISLTSDELRKPVNDEWVSRFPDPSSRPSRHVTVKSLRSGMAIQIKFLAVIEIQATHSND